MATKALKAVGETVESSGTLNQSARMRGIALMLEWQLKAPPGLTLREWIEQGRPLKA